MKRIAMTTDDNPEELWPNLPKELLPHIASYLNPTALHRFRSSGPVYRSAAPPSLPFSHTRISLHRVRHGSRRDHNLTLVQNKIYLLQPLSSTSTATDPSTIKGWIIMVDNDSPHRQSLRFRLLDPFTNRPLSASQTHSFDDDTSPKLLNPLNFQISDLAEAYSFNYGDGYFRVEGVVRVVLLPSLTSRTVFALYEDGTLRVSKIGGEGQTVVDGKGYQLDDVILHDGKLYAVDKYSGTLFYVDRSSLNLVSFSAALSPSGNKKHLVRRGESLHVVDIFFKWEDVVDVKVYEFDVDLGWKNVENLGDDVLVLGGGAKFTLRAEDYYGCKDEKNCVYFCFRNRVHAFSLGTSRVKRPALFWPCPSLFKTRFNT